MKEEDRLPQEYLDFIRAFVANKDGRDGRYPDLADMLVALWNDGDPAAPAPFLPNYPLGVALLAAYVNFSRTKWWAWDALDRLFVMLMERREPIPEPLQIHVNHAYRRHVDPEYKRGTKRPNKPRNPRYAPQDARDMRIMRMYKDLRGAGMTEKDAKDNIVEALVENIDDEAVFHMEGDAVRKIFSKMQTFSPFKSETKRRA